MNCPACKEGRPDQIANGRRFFAGRLTDAYLNRDVAARGYALIFWRGRHVAELTDLTPDEVCALATEVRLVSMAVEAVYKPAKLNYLMLGNSLPHLHVHIVPRYLDDPDPGRPPLFMMGDQSWPPIPDADYAHQVDDLRGSIRRLNGDR